MAPHTSAQDVLRDADGLVGTGASVLARCVRPMGKDVLGEADGLVHADVDRAGEVQGTGLQPRRTAQEKGIRNSKKLELKINCNN